MSCPQSIVEVTRPYLARWIGGDITVETIAAETGCPEPGIRAAIHELTRPVSHAPAPVIAETAHRLRAVLAEEVELLARVEARVSAIRAAIAVLE